MISVIVCSVSIELREQLKYNINKTIGVPYELIIIDNSIRKRSIFQVYNEGNTRAQYNIVVYVHEDVLFKTKDWGQVLITYFEVVEGVGCIGIAGAIYKSKAPSAWWDVAERYKVSHLIQWDTIKQPIYESRGWEGKSWKELSVIDGVFMATAKSCNLYFDENMPGFHCYDLNLSLEARRKGLKVIATNEILLEHLSYGNVNRDWVISTHIFHKKYRHLLPINQTGRPDNTFLEKDNLVKFIKLALQHGLKKIAFYYWMQYFIKKPFSWQHYEVLRQSIKN